MVVNKIQGLKPGEGLNAETGEYGDLIKAGVIDPTMVTRSALQNAASIAKNILTTEAIVAEPPEKDGRRHARRRYAGHGRHDVTRLPGDSFRRGPGRKARASSASTRPDGLPVTLSPLRGGSGVTDQVKRSQWGLAATRSTSGRSRRRGS